MEPTSYFIESSLRKAFEKANNQAKDHPKGEDPFYTELAKALDWYAFTLAADLHLDGITNWQTVPSLTEVNITSTTEKTEPPPKHKLIKEARPGQITLSQPLMYLVKHGDSLSSISWTITGRSASISELRRWNRISGDVIKPEQLLWLADPQDPLVREISRKYGRSVLQSRNPVIELGRLKRETAAKLDNIMQRRYEIEIKLEFNEPWEQFLNPALLPEELGRGIPWVKSNSTGTITPIGDFRERGNVQKERQHTSSTDIFLAGIGTSAMAGDIYSKRIMQSRSGFTSGKIFSGSPRVFSKVTASKVNFAAKGVGWGLTLWSIYNTENQFRCGEINEDRRIYNHMNNGVGIVFPYFAVPIALGDYYGQTHSNDIINDITQPGGFTFEIVKFGLELFGIPTSPDDKY